jgi:hypothetical protein
MMTTTWATQWNRQNNVHEAISPLILFPVFTARWGGSEDLFIAVVNHI